MLHMNYVLSPKLTQPLTCQWLKHVEHVNITKFVHNRHVTLNQWLLLQYVSSLKWYTICFK